MADANRQSDGVHEGTAGVEPPARVVASVGAVVAGLLAIFVLSIATDIVMHASGIFPPWLEPMVPRLWGLALGYRVVYGVMGAGITASLAPRRAMKHAMILAWIGVVLSTIGVAVNWGKGEEFGPMWFNLGIVAISLPCSWIGAKLAMSMRRDVVSH